MTRAAPKSGQRRARRVRTPNRFGSRGLPSPASPGEPVERRGQRVAVVLVESLNVVAVSSRPGWIRSGRRAVGPPPSATRCSAGGLHRGITERAVRGNAGSIRIAASGLAPYREVGRTTAAFALALDMANPFDNPGGLPFETYSVTSTGTGDGCSDTYEEQGYRWARVFDAFAARWSRSDAPDRPGRPYTVKGFTRGANPVFLERVKRDVGDVGGWPADMTTTIRIIHTPIRVG
jgi:hypothetical protein